MARDLDMEDQRRERLAEMTSVEALVSSNEFKYFLSLVAARIDRDLLALEKDSDAVATATIRGRIAALRSIPNILNDRRTTLANELR